MAENFFILKTECIYQYKPAAFSVVNGRIDCYIQISKFQVLPESCPVRECCM